MISFREFSSQQHLERGGWSRSAGASSNKILTRRFWGKLFGKTQYDDSDATDIEDPVPFKSKVKRHKQGDEDVEHEHHHDDDDGEDEDVNEDASKDKDVDAGNDADADMDAEDDANQQLFG